MDSPMKNPLRTNQQGVNLLASGMRPLIHAGLSASDFQAISANISEVRYKCKQVQRKIRLNPVVALTVIWIVHSLGHVKKPLNRVNAGRLSVKRIGRSHQEQRNQCDDSSERCIRFSSGKGFFWSFPLGKPLLKLN